MLSHPPRVNSGMAYREVVHLGSPALVPQFIPMPVLYGVFLYMGVASLNGVQVSHQQAQGFFHSPIALPFSFAASSAFPINP